MSFTVEPQPLNLFVAGLSGVTTEKQLRELFEKFGPVTSTKIMLDPRTGASRGFGFVLFANRADAEKAQAELNGTLFGAGTLHISVSQHDGKAEQTTRVYVRNIPSHCSEADVKGYFGRFGPISDMLLRPDSWSPQGGVMQQQVTIEFASTDAAKAAVDGAHGERPWEGESPLLAKFAESAQHRASKKMRAGHSSKHYQQGMLNHPAAHGGQQQAAMPQQMMMPMQHMMQPQMMAPMQQPMMMAPQQMMPMQQQQQQQPPMMAPPPMQQPLMMAPQQPMMLPMQQPMQQQPMMPSGQPQMMPMQPAPAYQQPMLPALAQAM